MAAEFERSRLRSPFRIGMRTQLFLLFFRSVSGNPAVSLPNTTTTQKKQMKLSVTDIITQATLRGVTKTASSGTWAELTTLSSPQATVSVPSRSKALSWSFPTFWNAAFPQYPMK